MQLMPRLTKAAMCYFKQIPKNKMPTVRPDLYPYSNLPTSASFRVAEILAGDTSDPISCLLHTADWTDVPLYEAIFYAWGDPKVTRIVICDGKVIKVTESLYSALTHLRFPDRSRFLWADALWYVKVHFFTISYYNLSTLNLTILQSINQKNIPECSSRVRKMQRIYHSAQTVVV